MTKKLGGSALSRGKPPTYESGTTSEKEVVLVAPLTGSERGEPHAENRELPADPIALYRLERDRRAERLRQSPPLAESKKAFRALLERDKLAGRGGRPKGVKVVNSLNVSSRPGKPRLNVTRPNAVDALVDALPFYGVRG